MTKTKKNIDKSKRAEYFAEEINQVIEELWGIEIKKTSKLASKVLDAFSIQKDIEVINSINDIEITEDDLTLHIILNLDFKLLDNKLETIKNKVSQQEKLIKKRIDSLCNTKNVTKRHYFLIVHNHFGNAKLIKNFKTQNGNKIINKEKSWQKNLNDILNNSIKQNDLSIKKILLSDTKVQIKHVNFLSSINNQSIKIDSRIKSATIEKLEIGNEKKLEVEGKVFTALLNDITKLYSHLGNNLYQYNLRVHVDEKNNKVDEYILKTLSNNPEEFWYLNNGITLLVDSENVHFRDPNHISLINIEENYRNGFLFPVSVINGAQTVSVANEFFSRTNLTDVELIERNTAIERAKVILRIVSVNTKDVPEETINEWINKISISLNRQKPIKAEDIVFNHYFIDAINKIENERFGFEILKRGENTSLINKQYKLSEVIKLLHTYIDKQPGNARAGEGKLLETESDDEEKLDFVNIDSIKGQEILSNPNLSSQEKIIKYKNEIFFHYYKPVNYLMTLERELGRFKSNKKIDLKEEFLKAGLDDELKKMYVNEIASAVKSYGKYHLIAAIFEYETRENNVNLYSWNKGSLDAKNDYSQDRILMFVLSFSLAWKLHLDRVKATEDENLKKNNRVSDEKPITSYYTINYFKRSLKKPAYDNIIEDFLRFVEILENSYK